MASDLGGKDVGLAKAKRAKNYKNSKPLPGI